MIDAIPILTVVALFIIVLIKAKNLLSDNRLYDKVGLGLSLGIAAMIWGLFTIHFLGGIAYVETSTIIDGASTITVTKNNNVYEYILPFTYLIDGLMWLIVGLTFGEAVMMFFPKTRGRFSTKKQANKFGI